MKKYYVAIVTGGLLGIFQSYLLFIGTSLPLSSIIQQMCVYRIGFNAGSLLDAMVDLLPFIIFQILYGTFIYKRFCTISVFYFSRCTKRITWFFKESIQLLFAAILYFSMLFFVTVGMLSCVIGVLFDIAGIWMSIYYIILYSLWGFITALIVNLIAIKKGGTVAFTIISFLEVISIYVLPLWSKGGIFSLEDVANVERNLLLLKCNPISHITFKWHTSKIDIVNQYVNELDGMIFDFMESVIVLLCMAIVVIGIGSILVKKHELIGNNVETGDG